MSTLNNILTSRIGLAKEFLIAWAIALAVRASLIFPYNYSTDNYRFLNYPEHFIPSLALSEMRYWGVLLYQGLQFLGGGYPFAGAMWQIVYNGALVAFAFLLVRFLRVDLTSFQKILVCLLFILFPYHADLMTYNNALPGTSLWLMLSGCGLLCAGRGGKWFVLAIILLNMALDYQLLFSFYITAIYFGVFAAFLTWASSDRNGDTAQGLLRASVFAFLALFIAGVLQLFVGKMLQFVLDIAPSSRMGFAGIADIPAKILLLAKMQYYFLIRPEASLPQAVKILQLTLLAMMIWPVASAIFAKRWSIGRGLLLVGAGGFMALAGIGVCLSLLLLAKKSVMDMRTLSGMAVYWGMVGTLAIAYNKGLARYATICLACLLAFAYALNSNRQSSDFARLNFRERIVASQIVGSLSKLENFSNVRKVVLVNTNWFFLTDGLTANTGGFGSSSLGIPTSSTAVLREVSGIPFEYPNNADRELAEQASEGRPVWPALGSVFIEGDLGVVVLPLSKNSD
jgi:hypothetical protein